jgi:hypothetical protein
VQQRRRGDSEQEEERLRELIQKMGEEKARAVAAEPGAASRDGDPGRNNGGRRTSRKERRRMGLGEENERGDWAVAARVSTVFTSHGEKIEPSGFAGRCHRKRKIGYHLV